jgi:hypothetical protein
MADIVERAAKVARRDILALLIPPANTLMERIGFHQKILCTLAVRNRLIARLVRAIKYVLVDA